MNPTSAPFPNTRDVPANESNGPFAVARILCVGKGVEQVVRIQCQLDSDFDFVLVADPNEGHAALKIESPFDLIISEARMPGRGGSHFLRKLRAHSPNAERLILDRRIDPATRAMVARDARVMKLLLAPCPTMVLREAVADALLRHRARMMRAMATPHVTPSGAHPCVTPATSLTS